MTHPTRADILGGHLILLRLAEQIPEIKIDTEVRAAIGAGDERAVAYLDQLASALTRHGVPFTERSDDHRREISFMAGAVPYTIHHVWDGAMAAAYARWSYENNVQVGRNEVQA